MIPHVDTGELSFNKPENLITSGIRITAEMFDTVTKNQYSDVIDSCVREVMSNAIDERNASGTTEPLTVHIPSVLAPHFSVTDTGRGMSTSRIALAADLGATDKQEDNLGIGGKGQGFLVVYAVADGFTVETVHEGLKYQYAMMRNEQRIPARKLLGQPQPTNATSGTTVKVPVRERDIDKFRVAINKFAKRFPDAITITGDPDFVLDKVEYVTEGKGWGIKTNERSSWRHSAKPVALIGGVEVPISNDKLREAIRGTEWGSNKDSCTLLDLNIEIEIPIGAVDIASSREDLVYTERTVKDLISRLDNVMDDIINVINKDISASNTLWEANGKLGKVLETYRHISTLSNQTYSWRGKELTQRIHLGRANTPVLRDAEMIASTVHGYDSVKANYSRGKGDAFLISNQEVEYNSGVSSQYSQLIIADTKEVRIPSRVAEWRSIVRSREDIIVTFDDYSKEKEIKAAVKYIEDTLQGATIVYMKDIPDIVPIRTVSSGGSTEVRSSVAKTTKYKGYTHYNDNDKRAWEACEVDIDKETGYYVDLRDWGPVSLVSLDCLHKAYKLVLLDNPDLIVYGIPGTYKNHMKGHKNWTDFGEYAKKYVIDKAAKAVKNKDLYFDAINAEHFNDRNNSVLDALISHGGVKRNTLIQKHIKVYSNAKDKGVSLSYVAAVCNALGAVGEYCNPNLDTLQEMRRRNGVSDVMNEIYDAYPLIKHLNCYWEHADNPNALDDLVKYINSK